MGGDNPGKVFSEERISVQLAVQGNRVAIVFGDKSQAALAQLIDRIGAPTVAITQTPATDEAYNAVFWSDVSKTIQWVSRKFGQKRWFQHDPDLDTLRSHPRFLELMASID